ncbi:TonB-dependent receptor [Oligella ureolytica]
MRVKLSVLIVASAFSMPVYSQGPSSTSQSTPVVELIGINIQTSANPTNNQLDEEDLQIKNAGNPQRALRGIPGVFTNQLSNQPGIEVSIRGLSGYGRINSVIDGVPQNFKNVAGHSSTGNNLLYVHPELLAGISVTRGVVSGAHGAGALAGAANMRTLSEEDVLTFGNTGGLTRMRFGNNGAHASGVAAVGHRFTGVGGDDGTLSIIAAGAYKNEGNYKTGDGSKLADNRSSDNSQKAA